MPATNTAHAASNALTIMPTATDTVDLDAHEVSKATAIYAVGSRTTTYIPNVNGVPLREVSTKDLAAEVATRPAGLFTIAGALPSARAARLLASIPAEVVGVVWNYDSEIGSTTERVFRIVFRK